MFQKKGKKGGKMFKKVKIRAYLKILAKMYLKMYDYRMDRP